MCRAETVLDWTAEAGLSKAVVQVGLQVAAVVML